MGAIAVWLGRALAWAGPALVGWVANDAADAIGDTLGVPDKTTEAGGPPGGRKPWWWAGVILVVIAGIAFAIVRTLVGPKTLRKV